MPARGQGDNAWPGRGRAACHRRRSMGRSSSPHCLSEPAGSLPSSGRREWSTIHPDTAFSLLSPAASRPPEVAQAGAERQIPPVPRVKGRDRHGRTRERGSLRSSLRSGDWCTWRGCRRNTAGAADPAGAAFGKGLRFGQLPQQRHEEAGQQQENDGHGKLGGNDVVACPS